MSARDTYQPHVYINGVKLAETRGLRGLVPVADIKIKWGGRDWFDDIQPATANLLILDPYGELLALEEGAEVIVATDPDERVLFRGTLETSRATYTIRQTKNGQEIPVWEVEVVATDPLAALAADRKRGPIYPARNGQVNRLHWGRSTILERQYDLQARSRANIAWRYTSWMKLLDDTLAPQGDLAVLPYTLEQTVSVLTVLRRTARIEHPLNRPYYDAAHDEIRLLKPPTASTLPAKNAALAFTGGMITLDHSVSSVAATELHSGLLTADSGKLRLDLKEYENSNRCVIKSAYTVLRPADTAAAIYGTHYEIRESTQPVTITAGSTDVSSVELETDFIFTQNENVPPETYSGIETLMRATSGWRQVPRFGFNVRDHVPLPATLLSLFRAAPSYDALTDVIEPFVIVGSPLQWAGSLPSFAVVGGELHYTDRRGWRVTCTPASVPTQPNTGTKLGDITLTNPLSAFADTYVLGDLQLI